MLGNLSLAYLSMLWPESHLSNCSQLYKLYDTTVQAPLEVKLRNACV